MWYSRWPVGPGGVAPVVCGPLSHSPAPQWGRGEWPRSRCGVAGGQKWPGRGSGAPPLRVWPVGRGSPPRLEAICDTGHGVSLKEGGPTDVASQYRHAFVARLEGNFVFCGAQ